MSNWIDDIPVDDDWLLDLLVDNELNDRQRRRLLAYLDGQPDGWRRCALAFLESQSYGADLEGLASQEQTQPAPLRPARPRRLLKQFAVAASLLLAFAIGMVVRGGLRGREEALAVDDARTPRVVPSAERPPGDVKLAATASAPVADSRDLGDDLAWQAPSLVPPEVVWALERTGYRVQQTRGHLTLETEDDGQIVVPLEETIITPVVRRVF